MKCEMAIASTNHTHLKGWYCNFNNIKIHVSTLFNNWCWWQNSIEDTNLQMLHNTHQLGSTHGFDGYNVLWRIYSTPHDIGLEYWHLVCPDLWPITFNRAYMVALGAHLCLLAQGQDSKLCVNLYYWRWFEWPLPTYLFLDDVGNNRLQTWKAIIFQYPGYGWSCGYMFLKLILEQL